MNDEEGALQGLDETRYWVELLAESRIIPPAKLAPLLAETDELISIFVTMVVNVKKRRDRRAAPPLGGR